MHRKFISLFFALLLVTTACASSHEEAQKDTPSDTGETVGSTSRKVVDATKEAAIEVKEGSKEAGKAVWGAMKDFGKGVKEGWNDATGGDGPGTPKSE
jgi:hypothetical protein